jgi:hypothetical protein
LLADKQTSDTIMIDLTIESLRSGDFRATARHHGTTIAWRDASTAKAALLAVLNEACGSHRCGNGKFDMTHLQPSALAWSIMAEAGLIQPEAAGPGAGDLAGQLAQIEGLLFEARSDIPEGDRARRDVTTAMGMVRGLMAGVAAKPEPAAVDWSVVGPKLAVALAGARKALRVALPHCPADEEHNGPAVYVGEWLDEVNEALALLPSA